MKLLLWVSVSLIFYTYIVYPILLMLFSSVKQALDDFVYIWRRRERRASDERDAPSVSIIIAAYNEADCIGERIRNLLNLDYPKERITIYVGSDGSSDSTAEILKGIDAPNVRVHIFEQNRGKISVLNDLVAASDDEILVMTDANTNYDRDTVGRLVRHFVNPAVGAVCGELHLVDAGSGENRDSAYWRYEQVLKFHEGRLGALLGANGAVYAIRRNVYEPLAANTIVDDFQIVMNIARAGFEVRYDSEARAIEEVAPDLAAEHGRRVRIGLGNYQALLTLTWALNPLLGWRFFSYFSHKVIRWFVPHLLIVVFISNLFLAGDSIYRSILLAQVVFYAVAIYGSLQLRRGRHVGFIVSLLAFFVTMNAALFQGFIRFFGSNIEGTWQRTAR